jgi:hypothetical protein
LIALFSVGNVILGLVKDEQFFLAGLVSLFLTPLGVAFTLLDARSRAIYNNIAAAARGLEGQSTEGPYTHQHKRDTGEEKQPIDKLGWHTVTLWALYLGYSAALLFISGFLFGTWWGTRCRRNAAPRAKMGGSAMQAKFDSRDPEEHAAIAAILAELPEDHPARDLYLRWKPL